MHESHTKYIRKNSNVTRLMYASTYNILNEIIRASLSSDLNKCQVYLSKRQWQSKKNHQTKQKLSKSQTVCVCVYH